MNRTHRLRQVIGLMIGLPLVIAIGCSSFKSSSSNDAPAPAASADVPTAPKPVRIDPEADRVLKATSDSLAAARYLSFKAEIWEDVVVGGGHKLSETKTVEVQVRRPNGLHVEVRSPKRSRGFWYDGKTATLLDRRRNLYATVDAPDSIDKLVDGLFDHYGVTLPLDDLIIADPYASASKALRGGASFGKTTILGVPCKQVAFGTDVVDWQLWVQDGGTGMPRKVVITYRQEEADPQYTAIFSDWVLGAPIPDSEFTFAPPAGAGKIDMLPIKNDE